MSPQKRLTQALSDPLLAPLLAQHYARVHASYLRYLARTESDATRRHQAFRLANLLQREGNYEPAVTTLVISDRQRRILAEAIGENPRGDDARTLAAMLRPVTATHPAEDSPTRGAPDEKGKG